MLVGVVVVGWLGGGVAARAEIPRHQQVTMLSEALTAFDAGVELAANNPAGAGERFRRAADLFSTLIADGVHNGKLYFNLGNTCLHLGEIGRAVLNYRRAEALISRDAALQANLRQTRKLCRTQIEPAGEQAVLHTAFFWHYSTSTAARFAVALGAWVVFWVLLIVRVWAPRWRVGVVAWTALILWVAAGASTGVDAWQRSRQRAGVTLASDIVVRKGNGESYDPQFKEAIHEGVEFLILEVRPGWLKIRLPDRSVGWIRADQAAAV